MGRRVFITQSDAALLKNTSAAINYEFPTAVSEGRQDVARLVSQRFAEGTAKVAHEWIHELHSLLLDPGRRL